MLLPTNKVGIDHIQVWHIVLTGLFELAQLMMQPTGIQMDWLRLILHLFNWHRRKILWLIPLKRNIPLRFRFYRYISSKTFNLTSNFDFPVIKGRPSNYFLKFSATFFSSHPTIYTFKNLFDLRWSFSLFIRFLRVFPGWMDLREIEKIKIILLIVIICNRLLLLFLMSTSDPHLP